MIDENNVFCSSQEVRSYLKIWCLLFGTHRKVFRGGLCFLVPSPALLTYVKATGGVERYIREFNQQLSKLDVHQVARELGEDAILVCYEGEGKFCHRHLVADWLRSGGYEVQELNW